MEHIHAGLHWKEDIARALQGRSFDLAVAVYCRLRYIAGNLRGKTPRLISVGGALPICKGWMAITEADPWEHMEPTPLALEEDHPLSRADGVDQGSLQVRKSEQFVMQSHREGHYSATHFRYPIVYGPRHIGLPEWAIIRRVRDGRRPIIMPGGGMVLLSRGFAENIADGIMLAVDNPTISAGQTPIDCSSENAKDTTALQVLDVKAADIITFSALISDSHPTLAMPPAGRIWQPGCCELSCPPISINTLHEQCTINVDRQYMFVICLATISGQ